MSTREPSAARREQLVELLAPVVRAAGYDLEEVSVAAAGRRSVIRVIVDSDAGVDLDAVAEISRAASAVLDAESDATFAGPYVLEVSSPGVDRPLTEQRHWRRAAGRLVRTSIDGAPVLGRVVSVSSAAVTLDVDGVITQAQLSALAPGRVEVEFARANQLEEADLEEADLEEAELEVAELEEADAELVPSDQVDSDTEHGKV